MVTKMNNFKELRLQDISNGALSNAVNEVEPTLESHISSFKST